MNLETLNKANQYQKDIEYLQKQALDPFAVSEETRKDFEAWKEEYIKKLQTQFNKL